MIGVPLLEGEIGFYSTTQPLKLGESVIVKTPSGLWYARVIKFLPAYITRNFPRCFPPIERKATEQDCERKAFLEREGRKAVQITQQKANEHGLPMKIERGTYTFGREKLQIEFRAPTRIDFRALVRDLAKIFRCRIEMIQVTSRDDARKTGGVGRCGLSLCCSTCLKCVPRGVDQVESKDRVGLCGKTMCCMTFEMPLFPKCQSQKPKEGEIVLLSSKEAKVITVVDEASRCRVQYANGTEEEISFSTYQQRLS